MSWGIATVAITIYDLARGMVIIEGATLGGFVILTVVRTATAIDKKDNQATTII
jgi:hypothetical protein